MQYLKSCSNFLYNNWEVQFSFLWTTIEKRIKEIVSQSLNYGYEAVTSLAGRVTSEIKHQISIIQFVVIPYFSEKLYSLVETSKDDEETNRIKSLYYRIAKLEDKDPTLSAKIQQIVREVESIKKDPLIIEKGHHHSIFFQRMNARVKRLSLNLLYRDLSSHFPVFPLPSIMSREIVFQSTPLCAEIAKFLTNKEAFLIIPRGKMQSPLVQLQLSKAFIGKAGNGDVSIAAKKALENQDKKMVRQLVEYHFDTLLKESPSTLFICTAFLGMKEQFLDFLEHEMIDDSDRVVAAEFALKANEFEIIIQFLEYMYLRADGFIYPDDVLRFILPHTDIDTKTILYAYSKLFLFSKEKAYLFYPEYLKEVSLTEDIIKKYQFLLDIVGISHQNSWLHSLDQEKWLVTKDFLHFDLEDLDHKFAQEPTFIKGSKLFRAMELNLQTEVDLILSKIKITKKARTIDSPESIAVLNEHQLQIWRRASPYRKSLLRCEKIYDSFNIDFYGKYNGLDLDRPISRHELAEIVRYSAKIGNKTIFLKCLQLFEDHSSYFEKNFEMNSVLFELYKNSFEIALQKGHIELVQLLMKKLRKEQLNDIDFCDSIKYGCWDVIEEFGHQLKEAQLYTPFGFVGSFDQCSWKTYKKIFFKDDQSLNKTIIHFSCYLLNHHFHLARGLFYHLPISVINLFDSISRGEYRDNLQLLHRNFVFFLIHENRLEDIKSLLEQREIEGTYFLFYLKSALRIKNFDLAKLFLDSNKIPSEKLQALVEKEKIAPDTRVYRFLLSYERAE
jgi:hypothetical protein